MFVFVFLNKNWCVWVVKSFKVICPWNRDPVGPIVSSLIFFHSSLSSSESLFLSYSESLSFTLYDLPPFAHSTSDKNFIWWHNLIKKNILCMSIDLQLLLRSFSFLPLSLFNSSLHYLVVGKRKWEEVNRHTHDINLIFTYNSRWSEPTFLLLPIRMDPNLTFILTLNWGREEMVRSWRVQSLIGSERKKKGTGWKKEKC